MGQGQGKNRLVVHGTNEFLIGKKQKFSLINIKNSAHIKDIYSGPNNLIIIYENDDFEIVGLNNYGQLGLGDKTNRIKLTINPILSKHKVRKVSCGYEHIIALMCNHNVFVWGNNNCGQLGIGNNTDEISTPLLIYFQEKVIDIACGKNHSLFLTECEDGNGEGHLGASKAKVREQEGKSPCMMKGKKEVGSGCLNGLDININDGEVGSSHSGEGEEEGDDHDADESANYCADSRTDSCADSRADSPYDSCANSCDDRPNCHILACGCGEDGKLGFKREENVYFPKKIELKKKMKITSIHSSYNHNAMLTSKGRLYTWGGNRNGELGIKSNKSSYRIKKIDIPQNDTVVKVSLGKLYSACLTKNHIFYVWGNNIRGIKKMSNMANVRIRHFACSDDNIIILTENEKLFLFDSCKKVQFMNKLLNTKLAHHKKGSNNLIKYNSVGNGCNYLYAYITMGTKDDVNVKVDHFIVEENCEDRHLVEHAKSATTNLEGKKMSSQMDNEEKLGKAQMTGSLSCQIDANEGVDLVDSLGNGTTQDGVSFSGAGGGTKMGNSDNYADDYAVRTKKELEKGERYEGGARDEKCNGVGAGQTGGEEDTFARESDAKDGLEKKQITEEEACVDLPLLEVNKDRHSLSTFSKFRKSKKKVGQSDVYSQGEHEGGQKRANRNSTTEGDNIHRNGRDNKRDRKKEAKRRNGVEDHLIQNVSYMKANSINTEDVTMGGDYILKHTEDIINRNRHCLDYLSFDGKLGLHWDSFGHKKGRSAQRGNKSDRKYRGGHPMSTTGEDQYAQLNIVLLQELTKQKKINIVYCHLLNRLQRELNQLREEKKNFKKKISNLQKFANLKRNVAPDVGQENEDAIYHFCLEGGAKKGACAAMYNGCAGRGNYVHLGDADNDDLADCGNGDDGGNDHLRYDRCHESGNNGGTFSLNQSADLINFTSENAPGIPNNLQVLDEVAPHLFLKRKEEDNDKLNNIPIFFLHS
ncbi:hypothetical protein C922_02347 [Plasmodium inui San Antonio 1]|uniref:Regulator of chromosome condensation n=1 Tax=Plasmodium inui San Antonio 1 TaxID=1237626 RepID=W7A1W0_9APIC|nr:hypothetical protein C922_02347 [Plasmodium inui San Antonio 1]EUD67197.1 hypothetical protein C922_02347 [Plasmodium inui San Antonio 1]